MLLVSLAFEQLSALWALPVCNLRLLWVLLAFEQLSALLALYFLFLRALLVTEALEQLSTLLALPASTTKRKKWSEMNKTGTFCRPKKGIFLKSACYLGKSKFLKSASPVFFHPLGFEYLCISSIDYTSTLWGVLANKLADTLDIYEKKMWKMDKKSLSFSENRYPRSRIFLYYLRLFR